MEPPPPTIDADYSVFDNASVKFPASLPDYKALETACSFNWRFSNNGTTITMAQEHFSCSAWENGENISLTIN